MSCEHARIHQVVDADLFDHLYEVSVCLDCGVLINQANTGVMTPDEIVILFQDLALLTEDLSTEFGDLYSQASTLSEAFHP